MRAPAALLIGLWAGLQLLFTFVGPAFGAVAWWAHLTGFVAGALMALAVRARAARRRAPLTSSRQPFASVARTFATKAGSGTAPSFSVRATIRPSHRAG